MLSGFLEGKDSRIERVNYVLDVRDLVTKTPAVPGHETGHEKKENQERMSAQPMDPTCSSSTDLSSRSEAMKLMESSDSL